MMIPKKLWEGSINDKDDQLNEYIDEINSDDNDVFNITYMGKRILYDVI